MHHVSAVVVVVISLYILARLIFAFLQMTFGEQSTEKESHDMLSYSFDQGINILDTAEIVSTYLNSSFPSTVVLYSQVHPNFNFSVFLLSFPAFYAI